MSDPLTARARRAVRFRQHGVGIEVTTYEGLFSAAALDPGTAFLLRWIADVPGSRVVDLGCGYGPLALWLAAAAPEREVLAVDRDALAVAATQANAAGAGLAGRVTAAPSLGWDDVASPEAPGVDLVVSNLPAKVGAPVLEHLLLDAWWHVGTRGEVAVVGVERIAGTVDAILGDAAVEVVARHANRGYVVSRFRFAAAPARAARQAAFERGAYGRGTADFSVGDLRWTAVTARTLPEFDTLSHATVAAVPLLRKVARSGGPVAVLGGGQGHLATALVTVDAACPVHLVDRDLLAMRTSADNVSAAGGSSTSAHRPWPSTAVDGCTGLVAVLPEKEPVAVTAAELGAALAALPQGSPVLLAGRTADVRRVAELLPRHGPALVVEQELAAQSSRAVLLRR